MFSIPEGDNLDRTTSMNGRPGGGAESFKDQLAKARRNSIQNLRQTIRNQNGPGTEDRALRGTATGTASLDELQLSDDAARKLKWMLREQARLELTRDGSPPTSSSLNLSVHTKMSSGNATGMGSGSSHGPRHPAADRRGSLPASLAATRPGSVTRPQPQPQAGGDADPRLSLPPPSPLRGTSPVVAPPGQGQPATVEEAAGRDSGSGPVSAWGFAPSMGSAPKHRTPGADSPPRMPGLIAASAPGPSGPQGMNMAGAYIAAGRGRGVMPEPQGPHAARASEPYQGSTKVAPPGRESIATEPGQTLSDSAAHRDSLAGKVPPVRVAPTDQAAQRRARRGLWARLGGLLCLVPEEAEYHQEGNKGGKRSRIVPATGSARPSVSTGGTGGSS